MEIVGLIFASVFIFLPVIFIVLFLWARVFHWFWNIFPCNKIKN